ncbi:helix-turn-helix domain-containing protein [Ideonella sp.]|uniref:AraC family transcriptional regulator n=1 Tax=Ideonella sp. TaxID=1929293 RepID=UPI003BB69ED3
MLQPLHHTPPDDSPTEGSRSASPEPLTRAPRHPERPGPARDRLMLPPPALQGAIEALIFRDTRGLPLTDAQRLSHFPASPLVCLSWYQGMDAGLIRGPGRPRWRPFGCQVTLSGSQSQPVTSWAPTTGRGGMVCLTSDAARALFGIDPAVALDRFLPASSALGAEWQPLCQALARAPDDAATVAALLQHLAPRWQALQGRASPAPSLGQLGRHWVDRLALQAHDWARTHSTRQVERRIKAYSGRSLREWRALVQTEGAFVAARARHEAGLPPAWAELAQDTGFADQAHLVRAARRITGFAPGEFAQRFEHDESFWIYRLWV